MKDGIIAVRDTCRVCESPLVPILSLGELYVSDFVDDAGAHGEKYPLELMLCNQKSGGCGLLQLKHTVSHETMYRNYWYRSGINKTMTDELCGIAAKVEALAPFRAGDLVIDIGANDGTLLRGYKRPGLCLTGFEPARNLIQHAEKGTTKIINDFFNYPAWEREFGSQRPRP